MIPPRPNPFAIRRLTEVPDAVPVLARWFLEEWGPHYGPTGPADADFDLREALAGDPLPCCLVAIDGEGRPLGTIALKESSVTSHRQLSPWLAALLVAPACRRRGVATALIAALEREARRLGFDRLYTATAAAGSLVERRGWRRIDESPTPDGPIPVYFRDL